MNYSLQLNIAQCATARAHIYGAEAMFFNEESDALWKQNADPSLIGKAVNKSIAAKLRYWREVATASRINGAPWVEAEDMGGNA
jgi:hypothetical protein